MIHKFLCSFCACSAFYDVGLEGFSPWKLLNKIRTWTFLFNRGNLNFNLISCSTSSQLCRSQINARALFLTVQVSLLVLRLKFKETRIRVHAENFKILPAYTLHNARFPTHCFMPVFEKMLRIYDLYNNDDGLRHHQVPF